MTDKERELALYCLKASSDYHSEICEECIKYPNCDHTIQDDVTETIIQALEQEPKWIPVSEKLPEETDPYINVLPTDVLVWEKYYSYKAEDFVEGYNIGWCWNGNWSVYGGGQSKVLAWMPLPKPYEPKERSDKE